MMRPPVAGPWIYPAARYYFDWYDEEHLPPTEPTDGEIKAVLVERLRENPRTKNDDIRVDVKRNVAILTGDISLGACKAGCRRRGLGHTRGPRR